MQREINNLLIAAPSSSQLHNSGNMSAPSNILSSSATPLHHKPEGFDLHLCSGCNSGACEMHGIYSSSRLRLSGSEQAVLVSDSDSDTSVEVHNSEVEQFNGASSSGTAMDNRGSSLCGNMIFNGAFQKKVQPASRNTGLSSGSSATGFENREVNCDLNICSQCDAQNCDLHGFGSALQSDESFPDQIFVGGSSSAEASLINIGDSQYQMSCTHKSETQDSVGVSSTKRIHNISNNQHFHNGFQIGSGSSSGIAFNGSNKQVTSGGQLSSHFPVCLPLSIETRNSSGNDGIEASLPMNSRRGTRKRTSDAQQTGCSLDALRSSPFQFEQSSFSMSSEGPAATAHPPVHASSSNLAARIQQEDGSNHRNLSSTSDATQAPSSILSLSRSSEASTRNVRLRPNSAHNQESHVAHSSGNAGQSTNNAQSQQLNTGSSIASGSSALYNPMSYGLCQPPLFSAGMGSISQYPGMVNLPYFQGFGIPGNGGHAVGLDGASGSFNASIWVPSQSPNSDEMIPSLTLPSSSLPWDSHQGLSLETSRSGIQRVGAAALPGNSSFTMLPQGSHFHPSLSMSNMLLQQPVSGQSQQNQSQQNLVGTGVQTQQRRVQLQQNSLDSTPQLHSSILRAPHQSVLAFNGQRQANASAASVLPQQNVTGSQQRNMLLPAVQASSSLNSVQQQQNVASTSAERPSHRLLQRFSSAQPQANPLQSISFASAQAQASSSVPRSGSAVLRPSSSHSRTALHARLQALAPAADAEGRQRIMNEIRSALEHTRRRNSFRGEDRYNLEQSIHLIAEMHDQHREMRLDVDNMSYEELLALEERIGNVNTGLSEDIVDNFLLKKLYSAHFGNDTPNTPDGELDEKCSICREEYKQHDLLGILPCNHVHHSECIKRWLTVKNLCPICRAAGLNVPDRR